ncbi:hypothetical protein FACS1894217_14500 [Clostridia bacterium]|nr:hypothetical protein FACS1894217_14500 [Clostridia bacterium]
MKKKLAVILAVMMIASVSMVAAFAIDPFVNGGAGSPFGDDKIGVKLDKLDKDVDTAVFTIEVKETTDGYGGGFAFCGETWAAPDWGNTGSGKAIETDGKTVTNKLAAPLKAGTAVTVGLEQWWGGADLITVKSLVLKNGSTVVAEYTFDSKGTPTLKASGGASAGTSTGTPGSAKTGDSSIAFIALAILLMAGAGAFAFSRVAKKD